MKSLLLTGLVVALMSLNLTVGSGQHPMKITEKKLAYLKKFRMDYCSSILNKKPELLQAYYADTIRLMPPFQKTIVGKGNVLRYQTAFLNRFDVHEFKRNEIEILDMGGQVLETGTFTMRLTIINTQKEHVLVGKYLNLWAALKNGGLSLITEAWNFDQYYGEIHTQLRFDEISSAHVALQPNVPVNSNISFELAALNRLLDATVTQRDSITWRLYYADDAMMMPNYSPVCSGRKAIDAYIGKHVKELPVFQELDIRNDRIDYLGIFIIEYASHIASWKNRDGSGVSLGKNIRIWRREPDHSLKLFRSISMYD